MKNRFHSLITLALCVATVKPAAILAQTSAATAQPKHETGDSANPGVKSYLLRTVKFTGSIRERWESTNGPFSVTPASSYLLSQERLGIVFTPASWLSFMAEAQDARALFYKTTPSNAMSNPFDLHQAWVELGKREGNGVAVKLGRQDMVIGSGHLLAASDVWWTNTARNFDVAYGSIIMGSFKAELVGGSAILVNPNAPDEHKPGDHIYADYNTFGHLLPGASVEPYFIARTTDGVKSKEGRLGNMDTLAAGARVIGKLGRHTDYSFEAVHEFGSYSNDRLNAAGLLAGAGWLFTPGGWKPRLSGDYTYASGDDGLKNHARENFDNMYGYNFPMNSLTGQFGWKNIKDLRSGVDFSPTSKLKIKVDGRDFWLANTADGLYNPLGTRTVYNPKATSGHVGESVEMMATAKVVRNSTVGLGVGTLFPGEYLKESKMDQAYIYSYVFVSHKF